MAYNPDWETLADALKRVVATGVSEGEAKTDLCNALADKKIEVQVRIEKSDRARGGEVFPNGNVAVPRHLNPKDFDWEQSRPTARWSIGPQLGEHYNWLGGWEKLPLDLIELRTADVIEILCAKELPTLRELPTGARKRGRPSRKLEQTKQAMRDDIAQRRETADSLHRMFEKSLAARYSVSRDTARKARKAVLSEFVEQSKATNDK